MGALREKSLSLTQHFIHLIEVHCAGHGLSFVTPREPSIRGSQVCLARKEGAYAIVQALSARGVIGDFRSPDIMRFGFAPLYTRYVDVWDAVEHLSEVLASSDWRQKQFNQQKEVT